MVCICSSQYFPPLGNYKTVLCVILCFTDPLVSYFISHVSYIIWYLRYSFLSCVLALTAANTPLSVFNLTQQMLIFHRCNSCSVFPRQPSSTW